MDFVNIKAGRLHVHAVLALSMVLGGCAAQIPLIPPAKLAPVNARSDAVLTPVTAISRDLNRLPEPSFKVPVAVYAFRDQTGQFKPQPDSNLSAAVTQGAASILVKALLDSGWYLPVEREGLQNLLTERRIARAIETPTDRGKPGSSFPQLLAANYIIEGGIVGFEQNVRTGGEGASLLGIGGDVKYQMDQVTVVLRSVDMRNGQIINSVSVTKTIYSNSLNAGAYRYISYKRLLQLEGGYSNNEPSQLAIKEAIESAVIHLTIQGIRNGAWSLRNEGDWYQPMIQEYFRESEAQKTELDPGSTSGVFPLIKDSTLVLPPQRPPLAQTPSGRPSAASVSALDGGSTNINPVDAGLRQP